MSKKTRRDNNGKFAKRSLKFVIFSWAVSFASLGLLYAAGSAVYAIFASFRSCDANNTNGLSITACGKLSLNLGDVVIIGLFVAASALTVTLFTAAWQASLRRGTIGKT